PWNQFVGIGLDLPIAIEDVERIEVVRGPASTVYGTNAFFGIVNIVTRGADRSPGVYGRLGAGTFGTVSGAATFATGNVNRQLRGSVAFTDRSGESGYAEDGEDALSASVVGHWDGAFAQVRAHRNLPQRPNPPYDTAPGAR